MINRNIRTSLLVLAVLVIHGAACQQVKNRPQAVVAKEEFMHFVENFSLNKEFQLERTKFPLPYVSIDDSFTKEIKTLIKKEDWKFENIFVKPNQESYKQIYDSFEKKMRDTDERVVVTQGLGNGIYVCYYFQRVNGKWYLVKKENLST